MTSFTLTTTCPLPFDEAVAAAREALAGKGFGVLTEIDMQATLAEKLGVTIAPQVILGACNPRFAHAAVQADPSVAALLPCNVVVRAAEGGATVVEAFDPAAMSRLSSEHAAQLAPIADQVRALLAEALGEVGTATGTGGE